MKYIHRDTVNKWLLVLIILIIGFHLIDIYPNFDEIPEMEIIIAVLSVFYLAYLLMIKKRKGEVSEDVNDTKFNITIDGVPKKVEDFLKNDGVDLANIITESNSISETDGKDILVKASLLGKYGTLIKSDIVNKVIPGSLTSCHNNTEDPALKDIINNLSALDTIGTQQHDEVVKTFSLGDETKSFKKFEIDYQIKDALKELDGIFEGGVKTTNNITLNFNPTEVKVTLDYDDLLELFKTLEKAGYWSNGGHKLELIFKALESKDDTEQ